MALARDERRRIATARERQIYVAAARLFAAKGFDATSMSDIAGAVSITKAGLYHFVESKEDLLFTIISYGLDELFEEVVEPARQVADPLDRIRFIVRNHLLNIGWVGSSSGYPITIVADEPCGLGPEKRRIVNARKRIYFELIRGTLKDLRDRGDIPDEVELGVAAHSIIGAILWTARWRRPAGRLGLEEIVQQITSMLLFGVLRPEATPASELPSTRSPDVPAPGAGPALPSDSERAGRPGATRASQAPPRQSKPRRRKWGH